MSLILWIVIAASVYVIAPFLFAQVRKNTVRVRELVREVVVLREHVSTLRAELSQVYLTEEDRKLLGLPKPSPIVIKAAPPSPPADERKGKKGLVKACTTHEFSAPDLEKPRRSMNRGGNKTDADGLAYVKHCLKCPVQHAKVWTGGAAGKWAWVED